MLLNDLRSFDYGKRFYKLSESLNKDFGIDVSIYDDLNEKELNDFLSDLTDRRTEIMLESEFNSYHSNSEYTKISLLSEAIRIILREIHPKRKNKNSVKEGYRTIPGVSTVQHGSYEDRVTTDISGREYTKREGLEGPFVGNDSMVYYYDPKAGLYYDPRSDMYMERDWSLNETIEEGNTNMTSKESTITGLSELLNDSLLNESELQRAEIVFATNDIVSRLGKMIEDLSKMGTDDIMPLVDGLRSNFGAPVAEVFSRQSEEKIQTAANGIDEMKSLLDTYREKFEGRISDEDSRKPLDISAGPDQEEMGGLGDLGGEEMGGLDDVEGEEMGGLGELEAEADSDEGPLGREKKAVAETAIVTIAGKRIKLTMEQVAILQKAKRLTEKVKSLNNIQETTKPETTLLEIGGEKFRITEAQLKSLIFAKNFQKRVNEREAEVVRLSESQALMLTAAKKITQKVNSLLAEKKEKGVEK